MSLSKIKKMEILFEQEGKNDIAEAIRAILGSDGQNGMGYAIDKENTKKTLNIPISNWDQYEDIILKYEEEFIKKCKLLDLDFAEILIIIKENILKRNNR